MARPNIKIKLHYDRDWQEYQVRVFINGVYSEDKTYFTDDKQDAIDTKKAMENELIKHPERYLQGDK
jgi:hypothetical protein